LKIVGMPSADRAAATNFIAGWCAPREREADVRLVEAAAELFGATSIFTPELLQHVGRARLARRRAVAVLDDLHARTPATMSAAAVEMLNVPRTSPPVPQVSRMTRPRVAADRHGLLAHDRRGADQLLAVVPFAASPPAARRSARRALPDMMCRNGLARLVAREVLAAAKLQQDVAESDAHRARLQEL
jgi:hypothetical protein